MANLQKSDLFDVAKKLDAGRVEFLIQQGLDPNALDQFGKPALYHVIMEGYGKNSHAPEFNKVRETIQVLLFYGARLDNLNRKEKSLLEDFMRGYKGKKLGATQPDTTKSPKTQVVKSIVVKTTPLSKKENEVFEEMKQELIRKKDSLIEEIPVKLINTFLDMHLESILLSLIGFALPFYIRNLKRQEFYAGDEFWSKLSLLLVLPIFAFSVFLLIDFWKEKKIFRLLLTLPPLFSSLVFVVFLFSLQRPQIRYARIIQEYRECFRSNQSICNPIQKGIYEDFLFARDARYLRKDEYLLSALAEGIRPHSIWSKLGIGETSEQKTLQEEFTRRGFVYYISQLENGKSPEEIFFDREGGWTFYAIAFAEANPDLLAIDSIPEEIRNKLQLSPSTNFPIGILNEDRISSFYKSILTDINGLSKEETQLAMYLLTQFRVDLDEDSFSSLVDHWISFNGQFEKELRHLVFLRNKIRDQMLAVKKDDFSVGVKFLEESDFEFYKPFLTSTGVPFAKGADISFKFHLEVETANPSKPIDRVVFPEILSGENEVPIYTLLSEGITPELNETYQTTKEETWIYALPASFVCKTCK